jgi:hypothetical protein
MMNTSVDLECSHPLNGVLYAVSDLAVQNVGRDSGTGALQKVLDTLLCDGLRLSPSESIKLGLAYFRLPGHDDLLLNLLDDYIANRVNQPGHEIIATSSFEPPRGAE